jgi:hypothetical protein
VKFKTTIIKPPVKVERELSKEERDYVPDAAIITPNEITELQGSLQELNNDTMSERYRTSGIDLRTRLYNVEIAAITVIDSLVAFKFLPITVAPLCIQKKRLAVSLKGAGRKEIVDIVAGKREQDSGMRMNKGFLGFGKDKNDMPDANNGRGGYR